MQWRSQKRKDKEKQEQMKSLKTGDAVLLTGGIVGKVSNVKEKTVIVRTSDSKIEVLRGAVAQILKGDDMPTDVDSGKN